MTLSMQTTRLGRVGSEGTHLCWHNRQQFLIFRSCRQGRSAGVRVQASIRARWCIDIMYGVKMDAVALLSEWVQNIGSQAGLTDNVNILSGAVGVPESRLELEVEFATLAELEHFWASIPPQDHKAWSQRAQHLIIDGSPKWDIYRTVPVNSAPNSFAAASTPQAVKSQAAKKEEAPASAPAQRDSLLDAATAGGVLLGSGKYTFQALEGEAKSQEVAADEVKAEPEQGAAPDGRKMVLDWKGDPMYINPGDKLPF